MWCSPGSPWRWGARPLGPTLMSTSAMLLMLGGNLHDATVASGTKLPDIYWNSSNPMFRIDNTDHIIDVNRGNQPFDFDQVDIICPSYLVGTPPRNMETYIIYLVSRHEYETCTLIGSSAARLVAKCDGNAGKALKYTITFRSFTPQPGGHEFRPGSDYYLISTSSGSPGGLKQDHGGACREHNMKLTFKVCCDPHDDTHRTPVQHSNNSADNSATEQLEETTERWTPFRRLPPVSTDAISRTPSINGRDRHRLDHVTADYGRGNRVSYTPTRPIFRPPDSNNGLGGVLSDHRESQQQDSFFESNESSGSSNASSSWCLFCDQSHLIWLLIIVCIAAAAPAVFVIR